MKELPTLLKDFPQEKIPQDFQSFPNRENSSQENEIRDIDKRNQPVREGRLIESSNMLSGEVNARMSREMETMMAMTAISERIIPEIQHMLGILPLSHYGVEPCTSTNEDGMKDVWKNANIKLTKKDSRSACDLRDHADNTPYTYVTYSIQNERRSLRRLLTLYTVL